MNDIKTKHTILVNHSITNNDLLVRLFFKLADISCNIHYCIFFVGSQFTLQNVLSWFSLFQHSHVFIVGESTNNDLIIAKYEIKKIFEPVNFKSNRDKIIKKRRSPKKFNMLLSTVFFKKK